MKTLPTHRGANSKMKRNLITEMRKILIFEIGADSNQKTPRCKSSIWPHHAAIGHIDAPSTGLLIMRQWNGGRNGDLELKMTWWHQKWASEHFLAQTRCWHAPCIACCWSNGTHISQNEKIDRKCVQASRPSEACLNRCFMHRLRGYTSFFPFFTPFGEKCTV